MRFRLREDGQIDFETYMIDSTAVSATSASAGRGQKEGYEETLDHALSRRSTALRPKIHLICDRPDWPISCTLRGQESDARCFRSTFVRAHLTERLGRPRKYYRYIVAAKVYDCGELLR